MAPLAATLSDDVAFVITIAAAGLTLAELMLRANRPARPRPGTDFDPRAVFAAVRVPILAFYGELDSMTPVEQSVAAWPPHATVVVVPDAGHGLHLPDGTLAPLYEHTLVDWLS